MDSDQTLVGQRRDTRRQQAALAAIDDRQFDNHDAQHFDGRVAEILAVS